ncbi:MAG: peptidoglycan DD-metalloendopeptidase family protein [Armatimonadetes bacterium]|nr:peptidoglycan DD-metalloendopeptidase family protein [Armatimonadota bacterium]
MKKSFWIVILGLTLVTPAFVAQAQSSKSKVSALNKTLSKVKSQRSQLQKKLKDKKQETNAMMNDIHRVDDQLENLEIVMEQTEELLQKNRKEQAELRVELQKSTEQLDQVKGKVKTRLRSIYTQGKSTPISILVGTQSVSDFASRKALIQRIADRDRELFEEVKVLRDQVLAQKKEQDRIVANIAKLKNDQEAKKGQLEAKRQERKKIFDVLWAQKDKLEQEFAAFEKESRRLEIEIARIQGSTKGSVPIYRGRFLQPVNGRLSSGFGYRIHPIKKTRKMHTGQDIAAAGGTPIKAAGDGKVITASYLSGYGNTVVIDHGGGVSTLYGHCSRLYVKVGQMVKRGDRIAAVGSTGLSTGNHLHWEVRINGKPVNPMTYR